jgi:hypothetical protein
MTLPTIYKMCSPRAEVLGGNLPDSIFAADLWDVLLRRAHPDYQDPVRFFSGSYPTENLAFLLRETGDRLAGRPGSTPVFRLETGFGGGKTHSLIAAVHLAREGTNLASALSAYGVRDLPAPGATSLAAFVGEASDPYSGIVHPGSEDTRTYTPWGEIAIQIGGARAYEIVRANDEAGVAPSRQALEEVLGDAPALILLDELVLYLAKCYAVPDGSPRRQIASQFPAFLQTLLGLAVGRPRTTVVFTVPSEQDANRRITAELKQYLQQVLDSVGDLERTANRQARNLTPTQPGERAAVLGRRLFERIDRSAAEDVANSYRVYYEEQKAAGAEVGQQGYEATYVEGMARGYPFHPELVVLFAERLADIPEFQATRGALRLAARTIRSAWENRARYPDAYLLQSHHVDLTRPEIRDDVLARLGKIAYGPGLDADVAKADGSSHAALVEAGWPARAASESASVVFLHSLPDGSKGITTAEAALAVGRPGYDLAYVKRGLEETEARAWFMRRDGDRYLFRTRASVNKRYQERYGQVAAGDVRSQLDGWVSEVYQGFNSFQVIPFPADQTAIADAPDRVRLVLVHYDTEVGYVGAGDRLSFTRELFAKAGVNASPRVYRNNLVFLLAEGSRVGPLKDTVRGLLAWQRVSADLEAEQRSLSESRGWNYARLRQEAQKGQTSVPAEFLALANDLDTVGEKLGNQNLSVRSRLLEAYRVLAFPLGAGKGQLNFWEAGAQDGPLLECFRVEFGELPTTAGARRPRPVKEAVAEAPLLECLRENGKLVREPTSEDPLVLAPGLIKRPPVWPSGAPRVSTQSVWDHLRRNPELPLILRPTEILPTFRSGVLADPEPLWLYYDESAKQVFTRETAGPLSPAISPSQFLYDPRAAVADRIMPVTLVTPSEIWDYLWPRDGLDHRPSCTTADLLVQARGSAQFPVVPSGPVLWNGLQEGVRERRWVLYLPGRKLAIGADELDEWPGIPFFDSSGEIWEYEAALQAGWYPRKRPTNGSEKPELTPQKLKQLCWSVGQEKISTEELERQARSIWSDITRSRLDRIIREGTAAGLWGAWQQDSSSTYYAGGDVLPGSLVGSSTELVDPGSALAQRLEQYRPGRGPQPVNESGTPREALTAAWDKLTAYDDAQVVEVALTVNERGALENTLMAAWPDRPPNASPQVSLTARGERLSEGRTERLTLDFVGRFDQVRALLAPVWSFGADDGRLDVQVTLRLRFDPPIPAAEAALATYRSALINANHGTIAALVTPYRGAALVAG